MTDGQKESDIKTVSAQITYLFFILKNCVSKNFLLLSNTYWSSKLNHIQIIRQIKGHCHSGRTSKYMYRYVILERKADLSWYIGCVCRNIPVLRIHNMYILHSLPSGSFSKIMMTYYINTCKLYRQLFKNTI